MRLVGVASEAARRCSTLRGATLSSGAGVSRSRRSQRRSVPLPPCLQLLHEGDEGVFVANVIEVGVVGEVRVARPALVGCPEQPLQGGRGLPMDRVYCSDV